MTIKQLQISGYRSLRHLCLDLDPVNVLAGPNGCGKSNLYNALFLLSRAANGGLAQAIAEEGGMGSVLWAGPRRKTSKNEPVRIVISVVTEEFSYELRCGLPTPRVTMFSHDPEVKEEYVWHGGIRRTSNTLFQRDRSGCWIRDRDARRIPYSGELGKNESVLSQLREPHLYPELSLLRAEMASTIISGPIRIHLCVIPSRERGRRFSVTTDKTSLPLFKPSSRAKKPPTSKRR